ncbi:MAG TPA: Glu-tRNA(Gln) amidotransferase GatDE subunit D, partial [Methanoculleus sp.]|nr:Glu-tRNA(Gln) amidotransferase GatDE subunit D [Methanoculleus sp.]
MIDTLRTGDLVRYTVNGKTALTGVYITERDGMAVIKLESGYNIGASPEKIEFIERPAARPPAAAAAVAQNPDLPELAILSTGGTIA